LTLNFTLITKFLRDYLLCLSLQSKIIVQLSYPLQSMCMCVCVYQTSSKDNVSYHLCYCSISLTIHLHPRVFPPFPKV
jgi:hypothetical protein